MEYVIPENIGLIPTETQSDHPETDTERRLAIDIIGERPGRQAAVTRAESVPPAPRVRALRPWQTARFPDFLRDR